MGKSVGMRTKDFYALAVLFEQEEVMPNDEEEWHHEGLELQQKLVAVVSCCSIESPWDIEKF